MYPCHLHPLPYPLLILPPRPPRLLSSSPTPSLLPRTSSTPQSARKRDNLPYMPRDTRMVFVWDKTWRGGGRGGEGLSRPVGRGLHTQRNQNKGGKISVTWSPGYLGIVVGADLDRKMQRLTCMMLTLLASALNV